MFEKTSPTIGSKEISSPVSLTESERERPPMQNNTDQTPQRLSFKEKFHRFPKTGGIAIIGSALTCVLSYAVLISFDNKDVEKFPKHLPKPAAWLSIVLSLNTLFVQMAVSGGRAVAWWYRASKEQTTVADLHNNWAKSSITNAILSWKSLEYVGLATIFVATLPINGILLQNAISPGVEARVKYNSIINYTIVAKPPPTWYSGVLNSDATFSVYTSTWNELIPQVIANQNNFITSEEEQTTCKGECFPTLNAISFKSSCANYTVPYDVPLDSNSTDGMPNSTFFSVQFSWDASRPYVIGLDTLFKNESSCSGHYTGRQCNLTMGEVAYPLDVNYNASGYSFPTWNWAIDSFEDDDFSSLSDGSNYKDVGNITTYPTPDPEVGGGNTTFGGIAAALQAYYGSTIVFHPTSKGVVVTADGQYARQNQAYAVGVDDNGNVVEPPNQCNSTFQGFGDLVTYNTPADDLLNQVRQTLFYTSVLIPDSIEDWSSKENQLAVQNDLNDNNLDFLNVPVFIVKWVYWTASVVVPLVILLMITPLYRGFAKLERKTSLSPFETARAFHAPILKDLDKNLDTDAMLDKVGSTNLHTLNTPRASPQTSPI